MTREFVVETDLDLTAVVEFEGIGQKFKPHEEIVRCKDCKYYLNSSEECRLINIRLHFYEMDKRWAEDCFCAWAERKKDE